MTTRTPEPPDGFEHHQVLERVNIDRLRDQDALSEIEIRNDVLEPLIARECSMSVVRLSGTVLRSSALPQIRATDCEFVQADCSNATWVDARLVRCAWDGCKATGLDLRGAHLRDVRFNECKLPELFFQEASLDRVWFESCNIRSGGFSGARLSNVTIRDCDAQSVRILDARIDSLDLRGSRIDHIAIDAGAVRNIIIDPLQAPAVLESLGARVLAVHEEL